MPRLPSPVLPSDYPLTLVQMVAKTSWLPHPQTVKELGRSVFPTVRARKGFPRCSHVMNDSHTIGMYDDNATPTWALLWSHNIQGRQKGWNVAHVWAETDCIQSFTHLANLALIPECFGTLTDKSGPLTTFLLWHAWKVYDWKPVGQAEPTMPDGYESITWQYFENAPDSRALIFNRLKKLNNQRTRMLLPLMQNQIENSSN